MKPYACDDLFLGSSPASVLEALAMAKQGRRVVVAEAGTDIGGVWADVRIGERTFADQAPHLIDARPGAYEFLSDQLDLEMEDVTRDAYAVFAKPLFGRQLYPYTEYWLHKMCGGDDNKRLYRGWSDAGHTAAAVKAQLCEIWRKAGIIEDRGSTLKYFKGGTGVFTKRLRDLLDQYGVEILCDRRIDTVECDSVPGQWVGNASGFTISAKSVVMNGHAFPDAIVCDGKATPLARTLQHVHSLFLVVEGNTADPFFYALFPESPLIHLAADLGYRIANRDEVKRVIVVTPHNPGLSQYDSAEAICLAVVEEMRDSGLIAGSSYLVSADVHSVRRARMEDSAMARVSEYSWLRVVESRGGLDRCLAALRTPGAKLAA